METAVSQIANLAIEILGPLLLALAGWLAHRGIKLFEVKTKIDVPVRQEAQVDAWILMGMHYAEEKARQATKAVAAKITGPEKLEVAAGFALDLAEKNGWIDWTRDRLKAKIEAKLHALRP